MRAVRARRPGRVSSEVTDAVLQAQDALAAARQLEVVGHEDQGRAALAVEPEDELDHRVRGVAVQVAGRLVAEEDLRAVDEGAGQGDPLLLAARELDRIMVGARGQAHPLEERPALRLAAAPRPRSSSGTSTFSRAVRVGMSWKFWKTKPTLSLRTRARRVLVQGVEALAG